MSKLPQAVATVQVDNERVRVTEWRFAPGAETGEHVHQMDYVVVPMGDGRLKLVSPQGEESFADLSRACPTSARRACTTTSSTPTPSSMPSSRSSSRAESASHDQDHLHAGRTRGRGRGGRDHLAGGRAQRHEDPAPVLASRTRLSRRRQLPRLHGRGRGRARAGRLMPAQGRCRHEGEDRLGAREKVARDGVRAAAGRPARARDEPRPGLEILELGRGDGRDDHAPLSQGRAPRRRLRRTRPSPSISMPASTAACACAPAAKCRPTT